MKLILKNVINSKIIDLLFNQLFKFSLKVEDLYQKMEALEDINIELFQNMQVTFGSCIRIFRNFINNREKIVNQLRISNSKLNYFTNKNDRKEIKYYRQMRRELIVKDSTIFNQLKRCYIKIDKLQLSKSNLKQIKIDFKITKINYVKKMNKIHRNSSIIVEKIDDGSVGGEQSSLFSLPQCWVVLIPLKINKKSIINNQYLINFRDNSDSSDVSVTQTNNNNHCRTFLRSYSENKTQNYSFRNSLSLNLFSNKSNKINNRSITAVAEESFINIPVIIKV